MSTIRTQSFIVALTCLLVLAAGRQLPNTGSLGARLDTDGGLVDCWNALLQLRSCTNEIVLFFVNGESYLSIPCCRAIRLITHKCWPTMLTSLGFTSEEGDILRGYCDAEAAAPPSGETLPPPPPSQPQPPYAPAPGPWGSAARVVF